MPTRIAVVYNHPSGSSYDAYGESQAVAGVTDSVQAVTTALQTLGFEVITLPLVPPVETAASKLNSAKVDFIFNLFEGFPGFPESESFVPTFCRDAGRPYSGCPQQAIELGLNKPAFKAFLIKHNLPTPGYQLLNPDNISDFVLDYPCIVKPAAEDGSHGITPDSVVNSPDELSKQVKSAYSRFGRSALVEHFIQGREFNVTVTDDAVFPVSEILYSLPEGLPEVLTFEAKWLKGSIYYENSKAACPADIDYFLQQEIQDLARKAFSITGCQGYARFDLRQDINAEVNIIEINPNPDISPDAGSARQAFAAGYSYVDFISMIVEAGLKRG